MKRLWRAKLQQAQSQVFGYDYGVLTILNAKADSELARSKVRKFPALWLHNASHKDAPYHDGGGIHLTPHF